MRTAQSIETGRKIMLGLNILVGGVALLCTAFTIWFGSMMTLNKSFSPGAFVALGLAALITFFFLRTSWIMILNKPGRLLSTVTLYSIAALFFSLAAWFCLLVITRGELRAVPAVLVTAIFGAVCIATDRLLKRGQP